MINCKNIQGFARKIQFAAFSIGLKSLLRLLSLETISQCGDNVVSNTYFSNHIFSKLMTKLISGNSLFGFDSSLWMMYQKTKKKKISQLYDRFLQVRLTVTMSQSHYQETIYIWPLSPQTFLVLVQLTMEEWKVELTLEPPSGFIPRLVDWESSTLTTMLLLHEVIYKSSF